MGSINFSFDFYSFKEKGQSIFLHVFGLVENRNILRCILILQWGNIFFQSGTFEGDKIMDKAISHYVFCKIYGHRVRGSFHFAHIGTQIIVF